MGLKSLVVLGLVALLAACSPPPPGFQPQAVGDGQVVRQNSVTKADYVVSAVGTSRVGVMQVTQPEYNRWGTTFQLNVIPNAPGANQFGVSSVSISQGGQPREVIGQKQIAKALEDDSDRQEAMNLMIGLVGTMSNSMAVARPTNLSSSTIALNNSSMMLSNMVTSQSVQSNADMSSAIAKTHLSDTEIGPRQSLLALVSSPNIVPGAPVALTIRVGADVHTVTFVPR